MNDELNEFCVKAYCDYLNRTQKELLSQCRSISKSKRNKIETQARKNAIISLFIDIANRHPDVEDEEVWDIIHTAHVCDWSGISNIEIIKKLESAQQSWRKSSGHAFEEMIKSNASQALEGTGIKIILQRDLTRLLDKRKLSNAPQDLKWLKEIKSNTFDLFATVTPEPEKTYCFGCIQSKTSVRERMGTDRGPSIEAMKAFFWSVIIVLNGNFMKMPEFIEMVNGGTKKFPSNGWHAMYVFSNQQQNGRIYQTSLDFMNFREDAVKAADMWLKQRQWLTNEWKAE